MMEGSRQPSLLMVIDHGAKCHEKYQMFFFGRDVVLRLNIGLPGNLSPSFLE
jgi:hypothetical protein